MPSRRHAFALSALLLGLALSAGSTLAQSDRANVYRADERDRFLPDTAVMAVVDGQVITVRRFIDDYFDSYAEFRPAGDSLGRVTFLNSLVDKLVLGRVVAPLPSPTGFERRAELREQRMRLLSNALFQRAVLDSVTPSDAEIDAYHRALSVEYQLDRIQVPDGATGQAVAAQLKSGRLAWGVAKARFPLAGGKQDSVTRWVAAVGLDHPLVMALQSVRVGGTTDPLRVDSDWFIYRRLGSRPMRTMSKEALRPVLTDRIRMTRAQQRMASLLESIAKEVGFQVDSANTAWAAEHFTGSVRQEQGDKGIQNISIDMYGPAFGAEDNERVLARWNGGQYTLHQFAEHYNHLSPVQRPRVSTAELLREQVMVNVLEPHRAELAERMGLEKDPIVVGGLAARIEQIKVEQLYEDSVASRVIVSDKERREHYNANPRLYTSFAMVEFAAFGVDRRTEADSIAARLRAGESAESILLADSLAGLARRGSVQTRKEDERAPFQKLIFEMMRPGDIRVEGPGADQSWFVLQLRKFEPGQLLDYAQVNEYVDRALRTRKEEALFRELLDRHRARYAISMRTDRVMQVRLVVE